MTIQQKVKATVDAVKPKPKIVKKVQLNLPDDGTLFFVRFRVKRPESEKAERRFMALSCSGPYSFGDQVEAFLDWCRSEFPGGRASCRGMFHGPLRWISPKGEVRFCGIVRSPVDGMEET